jgi:disulfide bond formation protein DsbB
MTDDPWINFFVLLTVGANVVTLGLWLLWGASRFGAGTGLWTEVRAALGEHGLAIAAVVATTATAGSLYLSEGAHLPPCELCWYQRIAMYSLALILVVGAVRRDWGVRPYALALALTGPVISIYHYLIERFPDWETGTSCDPTNPCTITWFWRLHYITIPMMALSGFLLVATVVLAARVPALDDGAAQEEELVR